MQNDILIAITPFSQLNTVYPSLPYLTAHLRSKGFKTSQIDLSIELFLEIFNAKTLKEIFSSIDIKNIDKFDNRTSFVFANKHNYIKEIDSVISYLQNPTTSNAYKFSLTLSSCIYPELLNDEDMEWSFGDMGVIDKAKHLCTLFVEDIGHFIQSTITSFFGFSKYAESLSLFSISFDNIYNQLHSKTNIIEAKYLEIIDKQIKEHNPLLIAFSLPFPGNVYTAFKASQYIKEKYPTIKIAIGGGYVNTELRKLKDKRVFEFIDFISFDDGELPLELILNHIKNNTNTFKRTLIFENNEIVYKDNDENKDYSINQLPAPDYNSLDLSKYISVVDMLNPMHSLWSNGKWNKINIAHGCYWSNCTFCDVTLDYICRFEPTKANILVNKIQNIISQTKETGFHFVDEAAPPKLLKDLSVELIKKDLKIQWWANLRFEKYFTEAICKLLSKSGCIAVTGGIEVASDRILKLIDKGVTVEQAIINLLNFKNAGIMTHAYLMYGFPTQTKQETINSLEIVRQMFETGILNSAYWHKFALTKHSLVYKNPDNFKIKIKDIEDNPFCNNDAEFTEVNGFNHDELTDGLKTSLYNYMKGVGFEIPLYEWFDCITPQTTIPPNYVENIIRKESKNATSSNNCEFYTWHGAFPLLNKVKTNNVFNFELKYFLNNVLNSLKINENEYNSLIELFGNIEKYQIFSKKEYDFEDSHIISNQRLFKILIKLGLLVF